MKDIRVQVDTMTNRSGSAIVNPQKIHLVFKTHLDLGYTDFTAKVKEKYFEKYIPAAIKVVRGARPVQVYSQVRFSGAGAGLGRTASPGYRRRTGHSATDGDRDLPGISRTRAPF